MRLPLGLLAAAIVLLPVALVVGGHNGATILGVLLTITAIATAITRTPRRTAVNHNSAHHDHQDVDGRHI